MHACLGLHLKTSTCSTDTFYGIICSGLTYKTRLSFISANSSFTECVRKGIQSSVLDLSSNTHCNPPSYEGCFISGIHLTPTSTTSFTHCIFSSMTASDDYGAAIYSKDSSLIISLTSCVLTNCTADKNSGAIYLSGSNTLTIADSLFHKCISNSKEADPGGGGLCVEGVSSSLSVYTSTFIKCKANVHPRGGGGFFASRIETAYTHSSIFVNCFSNCTGGAVFFYILTVDLSITDTLFSGNTGCSGGGSIREINSIKSASVYLKYLFFTRNTAPQLYGNNMCIEPELSASPFLFSFTTSVSNRVSYASGNTAHLYDDNWLPQTNAIIKVFDPRTTTNG